MENKDQYIQEWYDKFQGKFTLKKAYFHLIDLLICMRRDGLKKDDLELVGPLILDTIELDIAIESIQMVAKTYLGYHVKKAFGVVFRDIKEVVEEDDINDGIDENGIKKNSTDDIVPSTESKIDLSKVEYAKIEEDEDLDEYLSSLRFENYE